MTQSSASAHPFGTERAAGVDLDGLRAFVAVAEQGSFYHASLSLNLSPSALTRRIKRLEAALDTALFERTTRHVLMTASGQQFLPGAQGVLRALGAALSELDQASARQAGQLTLACIPTVAKFLLPRIVGHFHRLRPDVRLRLVEVDLTTVLEQVAAGEADFGVAFMAGSRPDLSVDELLADPYVLACPLDHPLAAYEAVPWRALRAWPLIVSGTRSGNRRVLDAALKGIDWRPDRLIEIEHLTTSLGLVEAGLGISVMPRHAIPREMHHHVAVRALVEPEVTRTIGLIRRRGAALSPLARDFRLAVRRMVPLEEDQSGQDASAQDPSAQNPSAPD